MLSGTIVKVHYAFTIDFINSNITDSIRTVRNNCTALSIVLKIILPEEIGTRHVA